MPSYRFVIADDHPLFRGALREALSGLFADATIVEAGSLDEAAALLDKENDLDLVLLDVMMPQKSGYEVCARMRERTDWGDIKIIMLSARGRDAEVSRGLAAGADVYVIKPFSTRELMAKIKELLDQGGPGSP